MCGRFYFDFMPNFPEIFEEMFGIPYPYPVAPWIQGSSILPYNDISAIHHDKDEGLLSRPMFWNLIPYNSPKFEPQRTWFNTRKEKLEDPYQKNLLRLRRCIIPVSGFFENKKVNDKPVYKSVKIQGKSVRKKVSFQFAGGKPLMALGGIYDTWNQDKQDKRYSCSIITQDPNDLIGEIHNRMPFVIPNHQVKLWLDPTVDDPDFLLDLIKPYPSEQLSRKQLWPPTEPQAGMQTDLF